MISENFLPPKSQVKKREKMTIFKPIKKRSKRELSQEEKQEIKSFLESALKKI